MKFKKEAKPIETSDLYYDLFDGGYIKPDKILEQEDAKKVNQAIETIIKFLNEAEIEGLIELI